VSITKVISTSEMVAWNDSQYTRQQRSVLPWYHWRSV